MYVYNKINCSRISLSFCWIKQINLKCLLNHSIIKLQKITIINYHRYNFIKSIT